MPNGEEKARKYAEKAHKGQQRKTGGEYVEHPKRVAEIVRKFKKSHRINDLVSAALLHDTLEDTDTTTEDLGKMFGGLVSSLVSELTSDKEKIKEVGKSKYLSDKMSGMSSWGLVIKLADRLDNVSDLKTADPKFANRYARETRSVLKKLQNNRKLSGTQKKIVAAIQEKLDELPEKTNEEHIDTAEGRRGGEFSIFKNPTRNELVKAQKEGFPKVRFIFDLQANDIYVFNAHILHARASRKLGIKYGAERYAYGDGEISGKKIEVDTIDPIPRSYQTDQVKKKMALYLSQTFEEEFKGLYKFKEGTLPIYTNPTTKELKELVDEYEERNVRFIADLEEEKVYVFSADVLHGVAAEKLNIPYSFAKNEQQDRYVFGIAIIIDNKLRSKSSMNDGSREAKEKLKNQDFYKRLEIR